MASPNLSEMITTTLRNRSGKLTDNITRNNALLHRLREKGNIKLTDGGRTIDQELEYAENAGSMWYSGYQPINITPTQAFTMAEFNWRQAAVPVTISGLEQMQNSGKEKIIDLLQARIKNAEKTMENLIAAGLYSNGSNTLQIGGLQLLVADSPVTGTVGGINRANWVFWQNLAYSALTNGGGAATVGNIQTYMNAVWVQLLRGVDRPDLIVADNAYWLLYLGSLQAIQRIQSDKMASAGFTSLKYMDADVTPDGGFQGYTSDTTPPVGGSPANHMYFLNTDYLFFRPHRERNMVPIEPGERFSVNQDAMVKIIGFMGNMTISNARMQGVLTS